MAAELGTSGVPMATWESYQLPFGDHHARTTFGAAVDLIPLVPVVTWTTRSLLRRFGGMQASGVLPKRT